MQHNIYALLIAKFNADKMQKFSTCQKYHINYFFFLECFIVLNYQIYDRILSQISDHAMQNLRNRWAEKSITPVNLCFASFYFEKNKFVGMTRLTLSAIC